MASTTAAQSEKPKIVLYWLEQSRSQRILWLLEALNLPYELKIFHRNPKTKLAPPELKEIHPLGKSPVISILPAGAPADAKPVVVAESANIIEYLLEHFGEGTGLLPKKWVDGKEGQVGGETEEWRRYRYFMHYAEGSLMSLMLIKVVSGGIRSSPVPFFIRPITNTIASKIDQGFLGPAFKTHFTFLESQLASSPNNGSYLCGADITGADILLSFPLIAAKQRAGLTEDKYPLLKKYVDKLEEQDGYKKAVDKIIELEGSFEPIMKL